MTSDHTHRTNIELLKTDVTWLKARYGYGWTGQVRELVHREVLRLKNLRNLEDVTYTLGDPDERPR